MEKMHALKKKKKRRKIGKSIIFHTTMLIEIDPLICTASLPYFKEMCSQRIFFLSKFPIELGLIIYIIFWYKWMWNFHECEIFMNMKAKNIWKQGLLKCVIRNSLLWVIGTRHWRCRKEKNHGQVQCLIQTQLKLNL